MSVIGSWGCAPLALVAATGGLRWPVRSVAALVWGHRAEVIERKS